MKKIMLKSLLAITICLVAFKLHSCELPIITLSHQELYSNGPELDAKLRQAARQGFFYLEMPKQYYPLIPHAVHFGNMFYKDEYYRNLELPGYSGYKDRKLAQAEGFYCEQSLWQQVYAPPIAQLAHYMKQDSNQILLKVLEVVLPDISQDTLYHITGGLLDNNGLYHLSYKHYRPEKTIIGLPPHRDFGYITILFIDKKGLHAKIDGKWHPIAPRQGFFIVNFGRALELLVNDPTRLNASWHYVEQITQEKHNGDRMCFALFTDNNLSQPLYQLNSDGTTKVLYSTYKDYVDEAFAQTYDNPDYAELV